MTNILKEVEFIDGNKEFLLNNYITQLLAQNQNTFSLQEPPNENTIVFSGDTLYFRRQVYKEADLVETGSYMIVKETNGTYTLKIPSLFRTSTITYTHITYQSLRESKVGDLYSVDYVKGILYTSSPIKRTRIGYRHSIQYYQGMEMIQASPSEYSTTTPLNSITDNVIHVYQKLNKTVNLQTKESIENPVLNMITKGDNYES